MPHPPRQPVRLAVAMLLPVLLCGCAGMKYVPGVSTAPPADFHFQGRGYPPQCTLVQRVEVDVGGRVFNLTTYLEVRRNQGFHGVGLAEMGVKVFDLRRDEGRNEILFKPKTMPPKPLLDGVIEDLWHLYRAPDVRDTWVRRPGILAQVERTAPGRLDEYQYDESTGRLVRSWRVANGRVASVCQYSDWRTFPAWRGHPLPARIEIRNRRWGYRMTIRLLELKVPEASSKVDR